MYEEKIKKALAKTRSSIGLSQSALAKKMGTTQEYVCRMEKSGAVSMEKLAQYMRACGGEAKIVLKLGEAATVIRLTERKNEGKK